MRLSDKFLKCPVCRCQNVYAKRFKAVREMLANPNETTIEKALSYPVIRQSRNIQAAVKILTERNQCRNI
jgi:hypothetical protein